MGGTTVEAAMVAARIRPARLRMIILRIVVVLLMRDIGPRRRVVIELLFFTAATSSRRHRQIGGRLPIQMTRRTLRVGLLTPQLA